MRPRVAAIIPAYNEEQTMRAVVEAARASSYVDETIVVSDGSTDGTRAEAEAAGAVVYQLPLRSGKGQAMLHGVAHTDASIILFLDADLLGLTPDHVERLLLPVLSGARAMNVGLRDRGPLLAGFVRRLPLISGERAMHRQVIEGVPPEFLQGYMVESALNYSCRTRGLSYGSVPLPGLTIRRKMQKVGFKTGLRQYGKMFCEVGKAMLIVRVARLFKRF